MLRTILLSLFVSCVFALYGPKSDVVQVGADNFKSEVLQYPGIVVVEFYAPWCGHCKSLAPEYEKAASVLKGIVKVVAVDATAHESLAQKYQIQGFPTLKVFGSDKKKPVDYQGQRTADAIISEGMRSANQLVKDRKSGGGKSSSSKKDGKKSSKGDSKGDSKSQSNVIELTDVNFNALVLESNDHWLVEFFAPWCGHCQKLAPEWNKAANRLVSDGVKLGAVDATVHKELAQRYGIKGYPTIKLFPAGPKSSPLDYSGARESQAIIDFALSTLEKSGAPIAITQLTDETTFNENCKNSKLCAILFVPHILDSGAQGRNEYLNVLSEAAEGLRKIPLKYLWSEAGAQSSLENTLSINGNYPTVAVLSIEKKIYAVPKISWNKKNIQSFLNGVIAGTEKTTQLGALAEISTVTAWDGKDGQLVVDEIPLDELFKEDL